MNYLKIYNQLIERAKLRVRPTGYNHGKPKTKREREALKRLLEQCGLSNVVTHHIVPKCMGGSNHPENLVYLTYKEHKLAHRLLYNEHKNDKFKNPLMHSYMMLYNYDKISVLNELKKHPVVALDIKSKELIYKFNSVKEAELFVNRKCICEALSGRVKTVAGLIWLYEEDYNNKDKLSLFLKTYLEPKEKHLAKSKSVIHITINENNVHIVKIYESIKDAANDLDVTLSGIINVCKGKCSHIKGKVFIYKETYDDHTLLHNFLDNLGKLNEKKKLMNTKPIIVYNKEYSLILGEYPSNKIAAEALNIKSYKNISFVCTGKMNTCGGYGFRYKKRE